MDTKLNSRHEKACAPQPNLCVSFSCWGERRASCVLARTAIHHRAATQPRSHLFTKPRALVAYTEHQLTVELPSSPLSTPEPSAYHRRSWPRMLHVELRQSPGLPAWKPCWVSHAPAPSLHFIQHLLIHCMSACSMRALAQHWGVATWGFSPSMCLWD